VRVLVFIGACEIAGVREGGEAVLHVAAAVVPVKVRVDDGIDVKGGKNLRERADRRQVHALALRRAEPMAATGLDQDCAIRRFDNVAVES